jgi:hypothetical protein
MGAALQTPGDLPVKRTRLASSCGKRLETSDLTLTVSIRRQQLEEAGILTIGRIYHHYKLRTATNIVSDTGYRTVLLGLTSQ